MIMMTSYAGRAHGRYKSAGERTVAEGLRQLGLNFSYEYPWAVLVQGKPRIFYPDFTLKDYGVVVEYLGMRGDQNYDRIVTRKEQIYQAATVPVIALRPHDLRYGWPKTLVGQLEEICAERQSKLEMATRNAMQELGEEADGVSGPRGIVHAADYRRDQEHEPHRVAGLG